MYPSKRTLMSPLTRWPVAASLAHPPNSDNAIAVLTCLCPYILGAIERIMRSPIRGSLLSSLILRLSSSESSLFVVPFFYICKYILKCINTQIRIQVNIC
jgi:hypothetical protein